jgi:ORF6N domain
MNNTQVIAQTLIENRIFIIRGKQVMIDYHLADLFNIETKRLNEQVKRNIKRFPLSFMFQLTTLEWDNLQSQIATTDISDDLRSQIATTKRRSLPYVFTEQGVAMLSAVLNSDIAIEVSIQIMDTFVVLRQIFLEKSLINLRFDKIELKQLETEQKFEQVFKALESKNNIPNQGVFFDGQVFDAYELASKIIRSAQKSIVLIDNYIDETTLTHLAKKNQEVKVVLLTKNSNKQLALDVKKANDQYGNFEWKTFSKSHDRFLIIDATEVYHLERFGKKMVCVF